MGLHYSGADTHRTSCAKTRYVCDNSYAQFGSRMAFLPRQAYGIVVININQVTLVGSGNCGHVEARLSAHRGMPLGRMTFNKCPEPKGDQESNMHGTNFS